MASGKPGAREAAKAEKEADIIIASLGRASEAATATTLLAITETLNKCAFDVSYPCSSAERRVEGSPRGSCHGTLSLYRHQRRQA